MSDVISLFCLSHHASPFHLHGTISHPSCSFRLLFFLVSYPSSLFTPSPIVPYRTSLIPSSFFTLHRTSNLHTQKRRSFCLTLHLIPYQLSAVVSLLIHCSLLSPVQKAGSSVSSCVCVSTVPRISSSFFRFFFPGPVIAVLSTVFSVFLVFRDVCSRYETFLFSLILSRN